MAYKPGMLMNCAYEKIGRTWTCTVHHKPSKHDVNATSRYPCLEVDAWTVKELDLLHERAGTFLEWNVSYRRKELVDREESCRKKPKPKLDGWVQS